jgi:hypothetical protein
VKRIFVFLITVTGGLVVCSTALANSLTCGHGSTCGPGQGGPFTPPSGGPGTFAAPNQSGTLPFTGLNLATIVAVAVLLLASGLVLHRMTRRRQ